MARGMVHFRAGDAHAVERRLPRLDQVRVLVSERYGEDYAEALLTTHPQAVIEGRALHPGALEPPSRNRSWFQFWK